MDGEQEIVDQNIVLVKLKEKGDLIKNKAKRLINATTIRGRGCQHIDAS